MMRERRTVLLCLMALCAVLSGLLCRKDNTYKDLMFSQESGFYEEAFELELDAPIGTEIYYTLDGAEPDERAMKYTEPIMIGDATENENVYTLRTDVSAGYLTEDIAAYSTAYPDPNYAVPDYKVDKCTVVRAAYRDVDGNFSEVKTESYFVGYDQKSGYEGMNIISVVTDPASLFDYDTGIYVLGSIYYRYVQEERGDSWTAPYWCWWNANYHQHGADWERRASVQILDAERELLLNQECGIRIQGGAGRGKLPKSINIYAREKYDGEGRFYVDLFETGYMPDTMTLFAGGDDSISKVRDKVASELTENRNFSRMSYEPYAMFLDGEYWGIYWLTEKYDDAFLGYYYGVEKDDVIMIKDDVLAEGEEEDFQLYTDMVAYMTDTDLSIPENYENACEIIDMQSFIDYFAAEIYIGRHGDWPENNLALWRTRKTGTGNYYDGRWRWMLYDVNSGSLAEYLTEVDTLGNVMNESALFCNLCRNEAFREQFVISFMDMANTSFSRERTSEVIANCRNLMAEPVKNHFKRFFGVEESEWFLEELKGIENFLNHRGPYIVNALKTDFDLKGRLVPVEVETNCAEAGTIQLNTIESVPLKDSKWQGAYYTDYPIRLTAAADVGYRFVRWEYADALGKTILYEEEHIALTLDDEGISIKAVFEKVN